MLTTHFKKQKQRQPEQYQKISKTATRQDIFIDFTILSEFACAASPDWATSSDWAVETMWLALLVKGPKPHHTKVTTGDGGGGGAEL